MRVYIGVRRILGVRSSRTERCMFMLHVYVAFMLHVCHAAFMLHVCLLRAYVLTLLALCTSYSSQVLVNCTL